MNPPARVLTHEIGVVLFDVGGVLVKLSGIDIMLGWLGKGLTTEEMWHRWLHSDIVRRFETGRVDAPAFARGVIEEFGLPVNPDEFLSSFREWPMELYPGTSDMLTRIPDTYQCALLSNSNAMHWPRIIDDMGLQSLISRHFVSHLTGRIKPDPEAFEHVLETLDCRPREVLFLDDNQINIDAAHRIGMQAVRVRGPETWHALIEHGIIAAEPS